MGLSLKKIVKRIGRLIRSPSRLALAFGTAGISEMAGWGSKLQRSGLGRTLDMAGYIAAAVAGGAAAMGGLGAASAGVAGSTAGVGGASTAAAGGAAAASGGTVLGMSPGTALLAGSTAVSAGSSVMQAREQAKAQKDAERQAAQAQRESEIMRKQALLTSQMSIGQRQNQAAAIANRLKKTKILGEDEEKLGG